MIYETDFYLPDIIFGLSPLDIISIHLLDENGISEYAHVYIVLS